MCTRPASIVCGSLRRHVSPTETLLTAAVLAALAASAPAQRQFAELGKRGLPANGEMTQAVASGDVDGDGDLDLVLGNGNLSIGEQSRLYLNDGTGIYSDATAARMPLVNDLTAAVALGDVDADGDLDVVFGNNGQDRLYLNDGTGTYGDATTARMPPDVSITSAIALGDVDGDGDPDMVIGNGYGPLGDQDRLYLNDGTGTYTNVTGARLPLDVDNTGGVAMGDVDGDGDLDLVFGNRGLYPAGEQDRLYLNDGTGTYTDATPVRMPVDRDHTTVVALGDVDRDGDLDLVGGNSYGESNRVYVNDGTGVFSISAAGGWPTDRDWTNGVVLSDVDDDGDLDVVFANGELAGRTPLDRLYLNDGAGIFSDATATRLPADADLTTAVVLGDVDDDGDLDMVLGTDRQNRLYLNDGAGTYTDATEQLPADADATQAVALGDADGDGDLDLVFGNGDVFYGEQNRLYLNDGGGVYVDVTEARMPIDSDETHAVALGDVDGDGDLDIVCGNRGQDRLYLNDGAGRFVNAPPRMPPDGTSTNAAAMGDVDLDGDLDLLLGNGEFLGGQQNRLYLNNGAGRFTDVTATRMPIDNDETHAVVLGDVDRDGDLDIVCGNRGQDRLYLNDGAGTYSDATAARMPVVFDYTQAAALGDVDGDVDLDVIIGNSGFPANKLEERLYLNDGTGTFSDVTTTRMPVDRDFTAAVALGDVDVDGDLDLVCGNTGMPIRLYFNHQRQLDAPFVMRIGHAYTLEAYARYGPPSVVDVAVPFLATATASIPLPPFGTVGIDPARALALPLFAIAQPAGVGSVSFTVPHVSSLAGISFHAQAMLVHHPLQLRLTSVTGDVAIR